MFSPAVASATVIWSPRSVSATVMRLPEWVTFSAINSLASRRSFDSDSWALTIEVRTRSELMTIASRWPARSSISERMRVSLSE